MSKSASHRKAMINNMVTSLFKHERIETTKAKAKALQVVAEKMITRSKVDSVHNRRLIAKSIGDEAVLAKLFKEVGPRFVERKGGYTRIIKLGMRQGDAAEMVLIELLKDEDEAEGKKKAKKKAPAKTEKKAADKPAEAKKAPAKKAAAETAPADEAPAPAAEAAAEPAVEAAAAETAEPAADEAEASDSSEESKE